MPNAALHDAAADAVEADPGGADDTGRPLYAGTILYRGRLYVADLALSPQTGYVEMASDMPCSDEPIPGYEVFNGPIRFLRQDQDGSGPGDPAARPDQRSP